MKCFRKELLSFLTAFLLICEVFLPSCRAKESDPPVSPVFLKSNKSISISLRGVMTANYHSVEKSSHTEFSVSEVPITWNGSMFFGSCYEDDRHNVADEVHGVISADGEWIEKLEFSQQLTGKTMMGITYTVTLTNIPVVDVHGNQTVVTGIFSRSGDVRKFVDKIQYMQPGVQYVSTDWNNTTDPPALNVTFSLKNGRSKALAPALNMPM